MIAVRVFGPALAALGQARRVPRQLAVPALFAAAVALTEPFVEFVLAATLTAALAALD